MGWTTMSGTATCRSSWPWTTRARWWRTPICWCRSCPRPAPETFLRASVAGSFALWVQSGRATMIEMNLVGVRVELPTNQPIVLLQEREGERYLPIWIGPMEATAIAFALQGIVTARPMTHDLMKNVLEELSVQVDRIVITELKDGTFYAIINMSQNGS